MKNCDLKLETQNYGSKLKIKLSKNRLSKFSAGFILFSLIFAGFAFTLPKQAEAAVPTYDIALNPLTYGKEIISDVAVWGIAKLFLKNIINDMIGWIQSGNNNKPQFITNFKKYLIDEADNTAGLLLEEILGADAAKKLCEPFRIKITGEDGIFAARYKTFSDRAQCTPSKILANIKGTDIEDIVEINEFYDFETTGWGGFLLTALDDFSNETGAYLAVESELIRRQAIKEKSLLNEIQANQGFTGTKAERCLEGISGERICFETNILTPGSIITGALKDHLNVPLDTLEVADELSELINVIIARLTDYDWWYRKGLIEDENSGYTPPGFEPSPEKENDAEFINMKGVPGVMVEGKTYTAKITMKNIGGTEWSNAKKYRLGSQAPENNNTWNIARVELPSNVAPGQSAIFQFQITAPAASSKLYSFQWRMVQDGVEWFGDFAPPSVYKIKVVAEGDVCAQDPPPPGADCGGEPPPGENPPSENGSTYNGMSIFDPASNNYLPLSNTIMKAGETYQIQILMTNNKTNTWTSSQGYKLKSRTGAIWGIEEIAPPNPEYGIYTFQFQITAPSTPNDYSFQWQMAQNDAWFGDKAPPNPLSIKVE
jgi:hypothetical protein